MATTSLIIASGPPLEMLMPYLAAVALAVAITYALAKSITYALAYHGFLARAHGIPSRRATDERILFGMGVDVVALVALGIVPGHPWVAIYSCVCACRVAAWWLPVSRSMGKSAKRVGPVSFALGGALLSSALDLILWTIWSRLLERWT
jgi:hypothetical protein